MRDFIVLAIILASMPISFFQPYYGILIWYWIAYFNPHRLGYSIHYYPIAQAIAIPTLLGLLFDKKLNFRIITRETFLMIALLLWYCVTLAHAMIDPSMAAHVDSGFDR